MRTRKRNEKEKKKKSGGGGGGQAAARGAKLKKRGFAWWLSDSKFRCCTSPSARERARTGNEGSRRGSGVLVLSASVF